MEEIINNIMQSPENTNPNVLRSQLQNIGGGSGGSFVIGGTVSGTTVTLDKTAGEIFAAMKKQNVIVVLEQPMEGMEEIILTFFMADTSLVNDVLYYTFHVSGGMQTVAATADVYPKMSLA